MLLLQKIDESLHKEHAKLEVNDNCYFFCEYAGKQGYSYNEMNQLIFNFKKPLNEKGKSGWDYKKKAIEKIAQLLTSIRAWSKLREYTWIPIPPSKIRTNLEYDDRLIQVLLKIKESEPRLDIREILSTRINRNSVHSLQNKRLSVDEHLSNLLFDDSFIEPKPKAIAIFDDVLTSGSSFKAAQYIIREKFPKTPIIGIFIARSIKINVN